MYLNVAWRDDRLMINDSHPAWTESITGPSNVINELINLMTHIIRR